MPNRGGALQSGPGARQKSETEQANTAGPPGNRGQDSGPARCPQAALPLPGDICTGVRGGPSPEGPERAGLSVSAVLQRRHPGAVRARAAAGGGAAVGRPAHAPARPRQQHLPRQADRQDCRTRIWTGSLCACLPD
uniref:(northern house mosquito) hypothetical protein n=1 Tax=Culex pipiens TaxID=7175 RepID=A0A8D8NX91_CULPI